MHAGGSGKGNAEGLGGGEEQPWVLLVWLRAMEVFLPDAGRGNQLKRNRKWFSGRYLRLKS